MRLHENLTIVLAWVFVKTRESNKGRRRRSSRGNGLHRLHLTRMRAQVTFVVHRAAGCDWLQQNGACMKRYLVAAAFVIAVFACSAAQSAPPIFKEKKYFGPIPWNSFSLAVGFFDGADIDYLTEGLDNWSKKNCAQRYGFDNFEALPLAPYARLAYERRLTPNHFFKAASSIAYLKTTGTGLECVPIIPPDTTGKNIALDQTFKVYLLSIDFGFSYYFVAPEVERFSPYAGAGFSAVVPMARLETESTLNGVPYSNPDENVSRNSFEAGMHMEFGMNYYITNRNAFGIEGRYQMAHSKFYIHNSNFDLNYSGFTLSLNLIHLL
jgi:opacity protein-like surface antigen